MIDKNEKIPEAFVDSFFGGVGEEIPAAPETKIEDKVNEPATLLETNRTDVPINSILGIETEEVETDDANNNIIPEHTPAPPAPPSPSTPLINDIIAELIDEEVLYGFEDDDVKAKKPEEIKAYLKELIAANREEDRKKVLIEEVEATLATLPEDLQYAVEYVKNGGTDLKSLFKILSQTQELKILAPGTNDREIATMYLQATNFGTPEEIEEQVNEWEDTDHLSRKASIFKPKLDVMQEKMIQSKLKEQEEVKEYQKNLAKQYFDGIAEALKEKDVNGIKITREEQSQIYSSLTQNDFTSTRTGQPINFLGKFLETITWDKPDYKMLAEITLLARDPEAYKEKIRTSVKTEEANSTVKKLKTSQGGIKSGTTPDEKDTFTIPRKTITRNSMLKRN